MSFDVAGVDHQRGKICRLARQRIEDLFKHACFGPTFPAVAERPGGAIFRRHIGVQSRHLVDRIWDESFWLRSPDFADVFVRGQAAEDNDAKTSGMDGCSA